MPIVLIVEDNPINRDVLGRRLERRGYSVRFAEDGPTGIEAAASLKPDIILMDIGLGELMDGWEATRRIKANRKTAGIPIIALTASAFESDRQKEPGRRLLRLRYQARRPLAPALQDRAQPQHARLETGSRDWQSHARFASAPCTGLVLRVGRGSNPQSAALCIIATSVEAWVQA